MSKQKTIYEYTEKELINMDYNDLMLIINKAIDICIFNICITIKSYLDILQSKNDNMRYASNLINPIRLIVIDKLTLDQSQIIMSNIITTITEEIFLRYKSVIELTHSKKSIYVKHLVDKFSAYMLELNDFLSYVVSLNHPN